MGNTSSLFFGSFVTQLHAAAPFGRERPATRKGSCRMSINPLTPAQRSQRARIAAHTRWAKEPDRLAATAPGRRAAFEKLLDEVDPDRTLSEPDRLKRARNAQKAQLERIRLAASKSRRRGAGGGANG